MDDTQLMSKNETQCLKVLPQVSFVHVYTGKRLWYTLIVLCM